MLSEDEPDAERDERDDEDGSTPMRIIWVLIAPVPMRLRLVQFLRNQRAPR